MTGVLVVGLVPGFDGLTVGRPRLVRRNPIVLDNGLHDDLTGSA
jgi:hypothetical protein